MSGTMVFQFMGDMLQSATDAFATPAITRLIAALQALALTSVTLYISLTGYAMATGSIEAPFMHFFKQCVKIAVISFFALTVDGYTEWVMGFFKGLEAGLTTVLSLSDHATTLYQALDDSFDKGLKLMNSCSQKVHSFGWRDTGLILSWSLTGLMIGIGTGAFVLIGGALIMVTQCSLALVFALGPLFVLCLMFPVTAKFFDSWCAQVCNYVLTLVIIAMVMALAMKAFTSFIEGAHLLGDNADNPLFAGFQVMVVSGILIWIVLQAGSIASGLAGGMSLSAMNLRQVMLPVRATRHALRFARNTVDPVSTRRDLESGMMVTARRANHLVAGNTVFNPAYSRHVLRHAGKNWGWAKEDVLAQQRLKKTPSPPKNPKY